MNGMTRHDMTLGMTKGVGGRRNEGMMKDEVFDTCM